MNIISHGIDLVECSRLERSVNRHGKHFLDRVFTASEQRYCLDRKRNRFQSLAGRFAVKEAVMKALGTGWAKDIAWTDMEILNEKEGRPVLNLHGKCMNIAAKLHIKTFYISISHTDMYAVGSVIAVGEQA